MAKKIKKSELGQIGIVQLLAVGGSIVVALIGGWFGQTSRTDTKLEAVKTEQGANMLQVSQRISVNETETKNLKDDVKEIKENVRELLRRLPPPPKY